MKENQSAVEGEEIAKDLMFKLGVEDKDLIKGAYIDLLTSKDAWDRLFMEGHGVTLMSDCAFMQIAELWSSQLVRIW